MHSIITQNRIQEYKNRILTWSGWAWPDILMSTPICYFSPTPAMLPDLLYLQTKNNSSNESQYWLTLHTPKVSIYRADTVKSPHPFYSQNRKKRRAAVHVDVSGSILQKLWSRLWPEDKLTSLQSDHGLSC